MSQPSSASNKAAPLIDEATQAEDATFGDLLRQLRRRAGLIQGELAAAAACSIALISRLETNERRPNLEMVRERFVPALGLKDQSPEAQRLLALAAAIRNEHPPSAGGAN